MSLRFRALEVSDFAGIESAELRFLPGLNVLHGPNDLGKSTLVKALRAALLLQHNSNVAEAFEPWSGDGPPRVAVEFEVTQPGEDTRIFRVDKTFGKSAALDERLEASSFRKIARNREVDTVLREQILRWGIRAPGRGAQA